MPSKDHQATVSSPNSLQQKRPVDIKKLVTLGCIAALVGIAVLIVTFADSSSGDFEAEQMTVEALQ